MRKEEWASSFSRYLLLLWRVCSVFDRNNFSKQCVRGWSLPVVSSIGFNNVCSGRSMNMLPNFAGRFCWHNKYRYFKSNIIIVYNINWKFICSPLFWTLKKYFFSPTLFWEKLTQSWKGGRSSDFYGTGQVSPQFCVCFNPETVVTPCWDAGPIVVWISFQQ